MAACWVPTPLKKAPPPSLVGGYPIAFAAAEEGQHTTEGASPTFLGLLGGPCRRGSHPRISLRGAPLRGPFLGAPGCLRQESDRPAAKRKRHGKGERRSQLHTTATTAVTAAARAAVAAVTRGAAAIATTRAAAATAAGAPPRTVAVITNTNKQQQQQQSATAARAAAAAAATAFSNKSSEISSSSSSCNSNSSSSSSSNSNSNSSSSIDTTQGRWNRLQMRTRPQIALCLLCKETGRSRHRSSPATPLMT
ncbi:hypothetical protein ACSSS7_008273 [Eimeria intestinalis]